MKEYKKIIIDKKGEIELSFNMIFAIIVGAFIIVIAVYAAVRFVNFGQKEQYSQEAMALLNYMNPVVNDISTAYAPAPIKFSKQTRIYMGCYETSRESRIFGKQTLAFAEESGFLKKWGDPGLNVTRYGKYIFSEKMMQGKTLYIFAKPLFFGFKVDDLIFLSFDNYCFVGSPEAVKEDIGDLNLKNVNFSSNLQGCKRDSKKVCFGFNDNSCNITVFGECTEKCGEYGEYYEGIVTKEGRRLSYAGSLLYGAIFSSPAIYDCNLKRLGSKASELAKIYIDKIDIIKEKNCNSVIAPLLSEISSNAANLTSSRLFSLIGNAKLMDAENNKISGNCQVYAPESG